MYQYSLGWFNTLFRNAIDNSEKNDDMEVADRCIILNDFFTYSLYSNVCRSLFEKHKTLFSLLLCIRILQGDNQIDNLQWRLLLSGAATTETQMPKPNLSWLTEQSWVEISNVAQLPRFEGLDKEFEELAEGWQQVFDSNTAHTEPFPGKWADLTSFERLLVVRALRLDKVIDAVLNFVEEKLGKRFIEPPPFDLKASFSDATNLTPIIFVLSTGADPLEDLLRFATEMRMIKKLNQISLGQGQAPKATQMISTGIEKGTWVLLQNCHLMATWMTEFERIVDSFTPDKVHRDFRLWLTSMPSKAFPVSVLQNGIKMTNEPPKGLKANVKRSYLGFDDAFLEESQKPNEWKKLLFGICLFHANIQERKKFGPLGWNIAYGFSDSDLRCCITQIQLFLDEYDDIPYKVMKILCGDVNYGGRVTDDWDRRTLMSILGSYICPEMLEDNYKLSPSGIYYSPPVGKRDKYLEYLETWPLTPSPEIFGMHDNADITCAQNEILDLFTVMVSLQPRSASGGGKSREQTIQEFCEMILESIPKPWNEEEVNQKYPVVYSECMNTVVTQEVVRYNRLLRIMHANSAELIRALKGLVVMSGELEKTADAIYNNQVPSMWESKGYPSLKPLASWVVDLQKRLGFVQDWLDNGAPKSFWLSGFYFPQAFLTGVKQNFARKFVMPVDTIGYNYNMLEIDSPEEVEDRPEDGCYVYGMFSEGAKWNKQQKSLVDPKPKELYSSMPMMWFEPKQHRQQPETGIYVCPLYKILTRKGTLSTTGHSTNFVMQVEIPSSVPEEKWVNGGVAMFLALRY
tara:strand:- start:2088 stop:4487 length:2400 start_codon:yes stop_codon:yes gene_type:complete